MLAWGVMGVGLDLPLADLAGVLPMGLLPLAGTGMKWSRRDSLPTVAAKEGAVVLVGVVMVGSWFNFGAKICVTLVFSMLNFSQ